MADWTSITTVSQEPETLTTSHYKDRTDWHYRSVRREGESDADWQARHAAFNAQLIAAYGPISLESQLEASIAAKAAKS